MMNLRDIRKQRGLTMKELGKKVDLSESAIGYYETGKREPKYETLLKLSEALDCSVFDILGENDQQMFLTKEERSLIESWRLSSVKEKQTIFSILEDYGMIKPSEEKDTSATSLSSAEKAG